VHFQIARAIAPMLFENWCS